MFHVSCSMLIGIDASRAFIKNRTGIEEYSYQVIKNLTKELKNDQIILYIKKSQKINFELPKNWKIKVIKWPYLWTQVGLSLEMLFHPMDVLFIPAHVVPIIHPARTIVTIHGLEYEFCPQAYSFWERIYMYWSIKGSCRWAKKIIAVSENTKKDLMKLYKVPEEKITVIYEGISPFGKGGTEGGFEKISEIKNPSLTLPFKKGEKPYLLFIGRIEARKNISGIIKAFEILKEKYKIPHKLILAGKPGYEYDKIKFEIRNSKFEICELGFVNEAQKWQLLKEADIFLFPTFYEGFGLPILEAQSVGVSVVASNNSSIPEVVSLDCHPELVSVSNDELDSGSEAGMTNMSALLVNPNNPEEIANAVHKLITDKSLKDDIIKKGHKNVQRFSWEKCAKEIAKSLNC